MSAQVNEPKVVFIYELLDPDTEQPRYIGQTSNLKTRLVGHMTGSGGTNRKIEWITSLRRAGKTALIRAVCEVPQEEAASKEAEIIAQYRASGHNLLNWDPAVDVRPARRAGAKKQPTTITLTLVCRDFLEQISESDGLPFSTCVEQLIRREAKKRKLVSEFGIAL